MGRFAYHVKDVEVLLLVAFSRWRIEWMFEDGKGELGLDHFEVRRYCSLCRHLVLTCLSYLFLAEFCQRQKERHAADDLPGADGDAGVTAGGEDAEANDDQRMCYVQDRNWNVVALVATDDGAGGGGAGSVIERYVYTPYGECTVLQGTIVNTPGFLRNVNSTSSVGNPFLHQGLPFDQEKGSYQNRHRPYVAAVARFGRADPSGYADGLNRYAYQSSKPVQGSDSSGLNLPGTTEGCPPGWRYDPVSDTCVKSWPWELPPSEPPTTQGSTQPSPAVQPERIITPPQAGGEIGQALHDLVFSLVGGGWGGCGACFRITPYGEPEIDIQVLGVSPECSKDEKHYAGAWRTAIEMLWQFSGGSEYEGNCNDPCVCNWDDAYEIVRGTHSDWFIAWLPGNPRDWKDPCLVRMKIRFTAEFEMTIGNCELDDVYQMQ